MTEQPSILDKAKAAQNLLERIGNKIPGFAGYRDRDLRRDADRLEREHLAGLLDANKSALNELALNLTRSGSLDLINEVETARRRLDKVTAQVRFADRGYSGFFDLVKVDEAVLGRVYQFDLDLLNDVEEIQAAARQLGASSDEKTALHALIARIDALGVRLSERETILSGVR
jgi:hypothetical protein